MAIAVKLVSYYGWGLAVGNAAEELLQEAVFRTLDDTRKWDPEVRVVPFLTLVMKSMITDDARTAASRRRKKALVVDELQRPMPADEALDQAAICEGLADRVLQAAAGDPHLESLALAMLDGVGKPADIATETGMTAKQVYDAKRKLERRMASRERKP